MRSPGAPIARSPRIFRAVGAALLLVAVGGSEALAGARPSPEAVVAASERVAAARSRIESVSAACFEAGWGWDPGVERLAGGAFVRLADSLIAHHRERSALYAHCLDRLRPLLAALRDAAATLARGARRAEDPRVRQLADVVRGSAERVAAAIEEIYPRVAALEAGIAEHLAERRRALAEAGEGTLARSLALAEAEHDVLARLRAHAERVTEEMGATHGIEPSPRTGVRLTNARIQEALARALERLHRPDSRPPDRRLSELRHDLRQVAVLVVEAGRSPDAAAAGPAVALGYVRALQDLVTLDGHLVLADRSAPAAVTASAPADADAGASALRSSLLDVLDLLGRVTVEIAAIDRHLR